ncbi:CNNM domain-containing protein [Aquipuribacter sp. MA13-6]|uniref:CNNM domain-containing protein n=1 Tax=unclassified Aquipuribacter TaxID=2635084 RepID=UPI003EF030D4
MNVWGVTAVTVLLIVLSAFFVIIEFALLGARRHRLEQDAVRSPHARAALRGMNELTVMLAGAQLGITACTFALGAVTKPAMDSWLGPVLSDLGLPSWLAGGAAFALSLLIVTFLHLVIGEMAPKSWAIAHPELAARVIGVPSRVFVWPVRPFLLWVNEIANRLVARTGVEPVDKAAVGGRDADTIRSLVEYSERAGVLESELGTQLSGVLELEGLTVGDITSPNAEPTAVRADAAVADVRAAAQSSGHLRILMTDEVGRLAYVVHVRDTMQADVGARAVDLARPVYRVDAATPVYELLRQMREQRQQLAVVEQGADLVGIVTLTDVVRRVLPGPLQVATAG